MAAAATATHDHNGHYIIALTTGNTDTLGRLAISCNKATYSMGLRSYSVFNATTFDAIITNAAGAANGLVLSLASNKVIATLASTDVTGNLPANLVTIATQTVTCGAGVTVGAFVGNATATLAVDASGRVDLGKILGTASAGAAGYMGIDWSHVNAPTTTLALSGTTISTSQTIANVTVGGYAANQDPGSYVLQTATSKLNTDSSGKVLLQPIQAGVTIPTVTNVSGGVTVASQQRQVRL